MPWCDACDRLVDDDDLVDGSCPKCGTSLIAKPREPLPWRFRFMIGATIIYLLWRLWQLIAWLSH